MHKTSLHYNYFWCFCYCLHAYHINLGLVEHLSLHTAHTCTVYIMPQSGCARHAGPLTHSLASLPMTTCSIIVYQDVFKLVHLLAIVVHTCRYMFVLHDSYILCGNIVNLISTWLIELSAGKHITWTAISMTCMVYNQ